MEKYLLNAPKQSVGNVVDSLFAEMVLEKALYEFRKATLQKEIDETLMNGNKKEFIRLSSELNDLIVAVS
ncbi:IDEAL domain-containing protein [Niallia nealsonii]|uniref:Phosphoesterase n=1 Tax=Niallia nealsonii TaxID=115979 RepID=A0A2N0YWJ8_9BACI|nr:IDEAL domain-containing protein [Niallia nealsonii]PKG21629.1 phosphoesterase [Niallia nealsonii]